MVVGIAVFVAQDGVVGREEEGYFLGVFLGFIGVLRGRGFAFRSDWSLGFRPVFTGDFGAVFS